MGDVAITVFEASLSKEGCHLLQGTCHVANVALKELVGAEKRCGSKVAIPEVRVGQDIGAVWNNGRGGRFRGVFVMGGLGEIKCLHAVATCRLRCQGSKVEMSCLGHFGPGAGGVVAFDVHVVL